MTDADPKIPPTSEEERESGGRGGLKETLSPGGRSQESGADPSAADLLLPSFSAFPPFRLVQEWRPDNYDEVLLDWWGEGYLMECGSLHADARLAEHDHGRILALVVLEGEDWVEECRALATA